ncbi:methyltransferase [Kribbella italica]|uniref:Protein-S-isoprenylcysteine O-methyltransferase Ste14 n=1 Tax=Kribbella italica TaxID=1540520 RepID=A0A7W9JC87_9ACTN|nr:methyltransferase [Kribbella italica]MBB5839304.1 protein-S-isoprenylcysteine O-methyltransferase Ste14 [Kribbella italica]
MTELVLVRWLCLIVPVVLTWVFWRRPSRQRAGAALLGFLFAFVALGATNRLVVWLGWWAFEEVPGSFLGMPFDLWIGWALCWGALPPLVGGRDHQIGLPRDLVIWVLTCGWVDLLLMPRLDGLVQLGPHWLVGEAVLLGVVLVPAVLLARWTVTRKQLTGRLVVQLITFTGLVLWLLPSAVMSEGDGSWGHLLDGPVWRTSLILQLMALAAVPALAAVAEFARAGGTPYPWDPPQRLVTTGPYAYLANPMQASIVVMLALLAIGTQSWSLALATVGTVSFAHFVADPHEREQLAAREPAWRAYDREVRPWIPRRRPYQPQAELYLAETCTICAQTRTLIESTKPDGLTITAAETYTVAGLRRALYVGPDGQRASGLGAIAQAFQHSGLGWAYVGWLIGLPVVRPLLQLLLDGMGGGERELPARRP